jgi:RNA polymerase sigma-70 factor (ECF subfamily)
MESAMSPPSRPFDLLVEHGAFLRRLARGLAKSDADADDLVQDTWVTALERPPRHLDAPRGWLGTAARRLNGKRRRAAGRRVVREEAVARAEAVEPPLDAALVLRDVVDAVLALEPEQRAVVTARFFEDLPVREIARRGELSVPAVKGRLRRALEKLRRDLDARHGGERRAWCAPLLVATGLGTGTRAPLAPAGSASLTTTLTTGVILMSLKAKTALALSALAALTWGAYSLGTSDDPQPVAPAARPVVRKDAVENDVVAPAREEGARESAMLAEQPAPEAAPLEPLATVEVFVTDLDGVPVSGVDVFAAPPAQPLNRVGRTDELGRLRVSWAPAERVGELVVQLRSRGEDLSGLRRLSVPRSETCVLRAALDPALLPHSGSFAVYAASGTEFNGVIRLSGSQNAELTFLSANPGVMLAEREDGAPRQRRGPLEPQAERTTDGGAVRFVSAGAPSPVNPRLGTGARLTIASGGFVNFEMVMAGDEPDAPRAKVHGFVLDRTGRPAPGVRVAARSGDEVLASARSGADGAYELDVPARELTLVAGADDERGARRELVLDGGDDVAWDPAVDRGLVLAGLAVDGAGEVFAGGRVQVTHALPDGVWIGIGATGDKGVFSIPHCPAQVVAVDVAHPEQLHGMPLAHHDAVATGGEPWRVTVDASARGGVAFQPLDADPQGPLAGELRVWNAEGTRGARVPLNGEAGEPVTLELPSGAWNLELGARGPHWGRSVPVSVDAGDALDLGALALESTGWLELAGCAEGETLRVTRDEPGGAVLLPRGSVLAEDGLLPLPAGRYRVERVQADGERSESTVLVRSAQRSSEPR